MADTSLQTKETQKTLEGLLNPRSIAIVGATERSIWSNSTFDNFRRFGFPGKIHLVNRRGGTIYGKQAATSCAEIGEPIDLALLLVPETSLEATFEDLAKAGVGNAMILSSGFAETGEHGKQRQRQLTDRARAANMRLLGPNCLGFVNYVNQVPAWTNIRRRQREAGHVALISQSGAAAGHMGDFAVRQNIPLSFLVSTGNECDVEIADVVEYLIHDPATKAIGIFLETVRNPARFAAAARAAHAAGKPVLVMKVGTSPVTAKSAATHTGAIVGDDRVFNAACRKLGIIRVHSPERLVVAADVMARLPVIRQGGLAFASLSGGMCEIAADQIETYGIPFPTLSPSTVTALKAVLPEYAAAQNPLDITGAALLDPTLMEHSLGALLQDPNVGAVACLLDAPETEDPANYLTLALTSIGRGFAKSTKPAIVFSNTLGHLTKAGRETAEKAGVPYSAAGIELGLDALRCAFAWGRTKVLPAEPARTAKGMAPAQFSGERETLTFLERFGVPIIPAVLATSAAQAAKAATTFNSKVVLKIASAQIAHKTDVGGVMLNVAADDVARSYQEMWDRVAARCPSAKLDGIIVSPMRDCGVELLVGVVRDPVWGPVIAVGLGGIFVEALKDTALRLLPVTTADVIEMLSELKGRALLDGFRGAPAIDRDAVAKVIVQIGEAALAMGPSLAGLDVNPLLVDSAKVEALDALPVWENQSP